MNKQTQTLGSIGVDSTVEKKDRRMDVVASGKLSVLALTNSYYTPVVMCLKGQRSLKTASAGHSLKIIGYHTLKLIYQNLFLK